MVSRATDAEIIDLMNEPPTITTIIAGMMRYRSWLSLSPVNTVCSPYFTRPSPSRIKGNIHSSIYPAASNANATMSDLR